MIDKVKRKAHKRIIPDFFISFGITHRTKCGCVENNVLISFLRDSCGKFQKDVVNKNNVFGTKTVSHSKPTHKKSVDVIIHSRYKLKAKKIIRETQVRVFYQTPHCNAIFVLGADTARAKSNIYTIFERDADI